MNTFVGVIALTIAALIHFGALQLREETVTIKLFLLAVAGIFFLRAEVAELRKRYEKEHENDRG